jgi:Raf kinase inhibitor-like YbhB/YbcL family protein
MSVNIDKFSDTKYLCQNHSKYNNVYSPKVIWTPIEDVKSYALIFEDPNSLPPYFIHWYIPYISSNINEIDEMNITKSNKSLLNNIKKKIPSLNGFNELTNNNKIKFFMGFNSLKELGYHGPCAPNNTGKHKYILKLYGLNSKIDISDEKNLTITNSNDFEEKFKPIIIKSYTKTFFYQYGNTGLSNVNN